MSLNNEHIAYIIKDITYRGIVEQDLQEELVDHICDLVETKMNNGERFIGAYNQVIKSFGQDSEIQQLQTQVIDFSNNNPKLMLKNYIKIAFRNLNRHKFYSFINVTGLAVGIACCLLITLFVLDELSYDQYHDKKDRIFRAKTEISWGELAFSGAMLPAPFAESVVNEYPEVEAAVRFRSRGSFLVARDSTSDSFKEERVIFADKDFFQMFTVPIISGDGQTALAEPNKVAISKSIADKYFPTEYALGKTLILDGRLICEVSAVYADIPENSHFHFDFLVSMISLNESENQIWLSNNFQTYLLLKEDAKADVLESKFPQLVEKYIGPQIKQFIGDDLETFYAGGNKLNYSLQPLTDIHLNSHFQVEFEPNGDIVNVYLFTAIALFILVIACINFMNLSTARSAGRAKEVGVRKVLGSYRIHLIRQFLSESVILSMLAFIIAIGLSTIMLPLFNEVSGKVLAIPFKEPVFYLVILFAALAIGILSGIYPAFFLSSFRAVNVLKGKLSLGSGSKMIRSFLVVFQFCISIILIIGTAIIFKQLNFVQNKRLGFNKEQILIVEDSYMLRNSLVPFKNDLQQSSNVKSVTVSGYLPVKGSNRSDTNFWPYGEDPQPDNSAGMQVWQTDYDYINTLGLKIIEGRGLSEEFISDSSGVVINQKALEIFGFESPIGEKIQTFAYDPGTGQFSNALRDVYTIVGVVEDFHYESIKQEIGPLGLFLGRSTSLTSIKFNAENVGPLLKEVEQIWKSHAPTQPFNYSFLNERFGQMYDAENRLSQIFAAFSVLAILIACLGLFALASFMTQQRTKEIGIRKVLGANVKGIVLLLSKEFVLLITIAFGLAIPVALYGMAKWFEEYSYKVDIGVDIFLATGVLALIIALLTISYQSIRAAISNPVDSLRNE